MEFSRQEYWSGQPVPPPEDLSNPRIIPRSPALQADSLPSEVPRTQTQSLRIEKKKKKRYNPGRASRGCHTPNIVKIQLQKHMFYSADLSVLNRHRDSSSGPVLYRYLNFYFGLIVDINFPVCLISLDFIFRDDF